MGEESTLFLRKTQLISSNPKAKCYSTPILAFFICLPGATMQFGVIFCTDIPMRDMLPSEKKGVRLEPQNSFSGMFSKIQ